MRESSETYKTNVSKRIRNIEIEIYLNGEKIEKEKIKGMKINEEINTIYKLGGYIEEEIKMEIMNEEIAIGDLIEVKVRDNISKEEVSISKGEVVEIKEKEKIKEVEVKGKIVKIVEKIEGSKIGIYRNIGVKEYIEKIGIEIEDIEGSINNNLKIAYIKQNGLRDMLESMNVIGEYNGENKIKLKKYSNEVDLEIEGQVEEIKEAGKEKEVIVYNPYIGETEVIGELEIKELGVNEIENKEVKIEEGYVKYIDVEGKNIKVTDVEIGRNKVKIKVENSSTSEIGEGVIEIKGGKIGKNTIKEVSTEETEDISNLYIQEEKEYDMTIVNGRECKIEYAWNPLLECGDRIEVGEKEYIVKRIEIEYGNNKGGNLEIVEVGGVL